MALMRARTLLSAWLLACLASAAPAWVKLESPHFTILSDGNPADARTIADQLERLRWAFTQAYPDLKPDASVPTEVFAVRNKKELLEDAPAFMQGPGQLDWGGIYLGSPYRNFMLLRLDAADSPGSFSSIYQSYAFALESAASQIMPPWLSTGLAEFWGATAIEGNTVSLGRIRESDFALLRNRQLVPLATLFAAKQDDAAREHWDTGSVYYAESWALVHYLIMTGRETRTDPIAAYLALLKQYQQAGVAPDGLTAARAAFGDLGALQLHLEQYLRRPVLEMMKIETESSRIDKKQFTLFPLAETDADAARGAMLAIGDRADDARALLAAVLRDAPNNATALEAMGMLERQDHHDAAALADFTQAAAADPANAMVQYEYAGLALQAAGGAPDDASAARIEASLATAIRLNPRFAPALDSLAMLDLNRGQDLPAAEALMQRACALAAGNFSFAYDQAQLLARLQRRDDAKAAANAALALARDPGDAQRARQLLDWLSSSPAPAPPTPEVTAAPSPTTPLAGAHRHALGEIVAVRCQPRNALDLDLKTDAGLVTFHSDDFYSIAFAATNFKPSGTLFPCADLVGYGARVEYVVPAAAGKTGVLVAILLTKK